MVINLSKFAMLNISAQIPVFLFSVLFDSLLFLSQSSTHCSYAAQMLAKLVSGMHTPAQQTVVPSSSVQDFLASLPVKKM